MTDGNDANDTEDAGEPDANEGNIEPDVGEYTVSELEAELENVDDPRVLEGMATAEEDGKRRKGAQEAIQKRMDALNPPAEAVDEDTEPKEGKYRENADELALDPA